MTIRGSASPARRRTRRRSAGSLTSGLQPPPGPHPFPSPASKSPMETRELASGLKFPEGPVALDDGDVILVEIARGTLTKVGADGRLDVVANLGGGPNGAALGARRRHVHHQQRRLLQLGRRDGAHASRARCRRSWKGGSIQRVDLATGAVVHPLHRVLERPAARAQRPRVRRPRRLLVHRPRRAPRPHRATAPASTTPRPTARAARRSSSRSTRPTASASRPTAPASTPPRPTPGRVFWWGLSGPGRGRARQPGRPRRPPARRAARPPAARQPGRRRRGLGVRRHAGATAASPPSAPTARPSSTRRCPTRSSPTSASAAPTCAPPTPPSRAPAPSSPSTGPAPASASTTPGNDVCVASRAWRGSRHRSRNRPCEGRRYPFGHVRAPHVLRRDARLPEEPGRLRQAHRHAPGRRAWRRSTRPRTPTSWWSTPAPSSRRPGRSRSTPCSPWPTARPAGAELVVTGCLAERYGDELAAALPEVDAVAGFGVPVTLGRKPGAPPLPSFDLLNLPRPPAAAPWAYVKVAEGCDKACGFCAIPCFRGPQRSRPIDADPRRGRRARRRRRPGDRARRAGPGQLRARPGRGHARHRPARRGGRRPGRRGCGCSTCTRPTSPTRSIDAIVATGVPYFDLSLQHVSAPLLRRMRRWGDGDRFLDRIDGIRAPAPDAAFRSNFIVGYPGETEADHDQLLAFVEAAQLDWCGFFAYSQEDGTYAADLDGAVPRAARATSGWPSSASCQDAITAARRDELVGRRGRSARGRTRRRPQPPRGPRDRRHRRRARRRSRSGAFHRVRITGAEGPDSYAEPLVLVGAMTRRTSGRRRWPRRPTSSRSAACCSPCRSSG